jgi:ferrochelatase
VRYAPPLCPARRLDPARRTGLLYLGLGGPDSLDAVGPFLTNLFADPMVLPLPAWLSRPLGKIIVARRIESVREKYRQLGFGGGSPQLDWTQKQAAALTRRLAEYGLDVVPAVAMRYWHPLTAEAVASLREAGTEQLLVVPTYPQYSVATTGSSLAELDRELARQRWEPPRHVLRQWPLLPGYVDLLARQAAEQLASWKQAGLDPAATALVYTAHSLPARFDRGGDAYARQTRATVRAVHAALADHLAGLLHDAAHLVRLAAGGREPQLAYQSKVGPVTWLGPPTEETCLALASGGVRHLLVVPVSFNCEHIETIDELDRELHEEVTAAGVETYARTPALNLDPVWLRSLGDHLAARAFGVGAATSQEGTGV